MVMAASLASFLTEAAFSADGYVKPSARLSPVSKVVCNSLRLWLTGGSVLIGAIALVDVAVRRQIIGK